MKNHLPTILISTPFVILVVLYYFGKDMNDATFIALLVLGGAGAIGGLFTQIPWSEFRWKK